MRPLLESCVGLLICLIVSRAFLLQSFVVTSGSMAEAIRGPHRVAICPECGFDFAVGASREDALPSLGAQGVCPNCGGTCPLDSLATRSGERLLVVREGFARQPPGRWQPVVFRDPDDARCALIKRVIGLPGESIQLRAGNIYCHEKLVRKSLAEQRSLAIVVHDAAHEPVSGDLPSRWLAGTATSGWQSDHGTFRYSAASEHPLGPNELEWLEYQSWQRKPGHPTEITSGGIRDAYGYNQGLPIVDVHEVDELLLSFRLRFQGQGQFAIEAHCAGHVSRATFDIARQTVRLDWDGAQKALVACRLTNDRIDRLEVSTIDQQIVYALDGQLLFPPETWELAATDDSAQAPFRIGGACSSLQIEQLRLFRDVYYIAPKAGPAWGCQQPCRLGPDEYFVLGDNSPLSNDSRFWKSPALSAELILGRPVLVYGPNAEFRGIGQPRSLTESLKKPQAR